MDAKREDCCYGRYTNDPLDDTLVNAKVITKGDRLVIIATTDIYEGDEIFISYGAQYWAEKLGRLKPDQAAQILEELTRGRGIGSVSSGQTMVSKPLARSAIELHAPGVRRDIVRSKMEQLTDIERESM